MSHTISYYGITTPLALYESNYRRFMRLWPLVTDYSPGYKKGLKKAKTEICIQEQHKYTTVLNLRQPLFDVVGYFNGVDMALRVCHDASLVEVVGYQGRSPVHSMQKYPNKLMIQVDEKKQLNLLLKEILEKAIKAEKQSKLTTCSE